MVQSWVVDSKFSSIDLRMELMCFPHNLPDSWCPYNTDSTRRTQDMSSLILNWCRVLFTILIIQHHKKCWNVLWRRMCKSVFSITTKYIEILASNKNKEEALNWMLNTRWIIFSKLVGLRSSTFRAITVLLGTTCSISFDMIMPMWIVDNIILLIWTEVWQTSCRNSYVSIPNYLATVIVDIICS